MSFHLIPSNNAPVHLVTSFTKVLGAVFKSGTPEAHQDWEGHGSLAYQMSYRVVLLCKVRRSFFSIFMVATKQVSLHPATLNIVWLASLLSLQVEIKY